MQVLGFSWFWVLWSEMVHGFLRMHVVHTICTLKLHKHSWFVKAHWILGSCVYTKFGDFHGCGCFDVKYVMGFFVWMLYPYFLPFNHKEHMICEKWEIRVHIFILGIWGFWWIWVVLIWTGSWVVVYACWRHILYHLYFKFFTFGYAYWFIRQSCSLWNLGLCWIWYNCLKLTTMVS